MAGQQANTRNRHGNLDPYKLIPQCVLDEQPLSNTTCGQAMHIEDDTVINIQLLYNSNTLMEPELWDGNFHPIFLHRSIEHIVLDFKNIRDFLNFMARYISNKQVDSSKSNDLEDFNGIGKAIWNFISLVYQANWDSLYANKQSNSLKRKIVAKSTPKIQPTTSKNSKEINKPSLANIERIPLSIPAKSQKEVNVISKFFKSNKLANTTRQPPKLYTQALKQNISTSKVIKIKEMFSSIGAKKIDQINNIVKDISKLKPYIQMTMEGPSRKHVIIPMSNNNNMKFMKNSSMYVANINRVLRNVKSKVFVNFIWSDPLDIIAVTNKVSLQSDLQIIEQYIKNSDNINTLQVEVPHFSQSKSYLKIIDIPYFSHSNNQDYLTFSDVKSIIKQNQIFDNITLTFKLQVIKVSQKSDMSIIWINIWDVQSRSRAKGLINQCFNIGRYIVTIREANMNSGVL